ncbi:MAG TPA: hypothetical protein VHP36_07695 [Chitinispirillaceae bacterium]|nr:hypothetical protein [Chitinispirillaceae bacterium]
MKINQKTICQMVFFTAIVTLNFHVSYSENSIAEYWQEQYLELNQKINEKMALKKSAVDDNIILDSNALILTTDRTPSDVLYRRTNALIQDLKSKVSSSKYRMYQRMIDCLKPQMASGALYKTSAQSDLNRFAKLSALNRVAALDNPLIDFDDILFIGYVFPSNEKHMCDQYNPWNINMGGGLYILKGIKTNNPTLVDVLKNSKCTNGSFKGSNLAGGAFLSPDLSYDGKTILFAWSPSTDRCYHIFKVNIDGTGLTQITDGVSLERNFLQNSNHNDFDPIWLPNGRIVFISDRRGGYGRCHTKGKPTFTLHSMKEDGTDIIPLSYHETNEWHPSVDNSGKIVYTRWDYVDRDDCIAHHLWTCYPDGRDPRSYHGNYPLPLQTITGSNFPDGRYFRPNAEFNIRAIPNSQKYIATSGPHHNYAFGDLVLIDPTIEDDGKLSQIKRLTNSLNGWPDDIGAYGTAWPLSEDYYLCNKDKTIILRDKFGNEQLVYSSNSWKPIDPIPVKARTIPPAIATATWQGERQNSSDHYRATLKVSDVYQGDIPLPAGVKVSAMRIVQVFPKETMLINEPRNGYPAEALIRMSLGTVPVESDGSVYCEAPVGKIIYFQLLDENGFAIQSMRSATYVHQGEQMACTGCHENKWKATPVSGNRIAFKREPSKLKPDAGGVEPANFARLVKPVFDNKCKSCHTQRKKGPEMSFGSLKNYAFYFCGDGNPYLNGDIRTPIRGGSRTTPGKFGASFAPLKKYIDGGHNEAILTDDEYKRVALWLDLNSMELGAEYNVNEQRSGKLVWPRIDIDVNNPQGIESARPLYGITNVINTIKNDPFRVTRNGSIFTVLNPGMALDKVAIYDLSGRCVCKINIGKAVNSFSFDLNKTLISKGTYILNTSLSEISNVHNPAKIVIH